MLTCAANFFFFSHLVSKGEDLARNSSCSRLSHLARFACTHLWCLIDGLIDCRLQTDWLLDHFTRSAPNSSGRGCDTPKIDAAVGFCTWKSCPAYLPSGLRVSTWPGQPTTSNSPLYSFWLKSGKSGNAWMNEWISPLTPGRYGKNPQGHADDDATFRPIFPAGFFLAEPTVKQGLL